MLIKRFKTLILLSYLLALSWIGTHKVEAATLPEDEVTVLNQIARTMGAINWNFDGNVCQENDTATVDIGIFKRQNLPGELPSELVNLPNLKEIDFAYNYLNGSIPTEWGSMQLEKISVFGNRLFGSIPSSLGNISTLKYLDLEVNNISGQVPPELRQLVNLETLRLSSNRLSGNLPSELADLRNLRDFRINDNNFNGSIPDFFQNWNNLTRLEIQGSGLEGPIPSSISALENLTILIISDINGANQPFPDVRKMTRIKRIILKKCSISGEIPEYVWKMTALRVLDLSFNSINGELEGVIPPGELKSLSNWKQSHWKYTTINLEDRNNCVCIYFLLEYLDLSYNSFAWQSPQQPACQPLRGDRTFGSGGAATLYRNGDNWGFSNTGDFRDDDDEVNSQLRFTKAVQSTNLSELYTTARLSPLSLTYYHYCLENGNYNVTLHFAEIQFSNNETYASLGRRLFDIYIQDEVKEQDFDIEAEAKAALVPFAKSYNVSVTNGRLEIRFYWAGKGTQAIPDRGTHGPLISAISLENPAFDQSKKKNNVVPIVVGIVGAFLVVFASGILLWRYHFKAKNQREKDPEGLDVQVISFTLKQIKVATNNFDSANKIGEGGFGPVYKGQLADGTVIAVKQLSSKSTQVNREFMNEIGMVSCSQHPNLVKLYGCCIEGNQLLLVYEYLENNCLSRALFGPENSKINLEWPTRHKICTGIAKGLAFLHEESRLKIVHRDIKGTNVLLDRDLNPKISDFGLAKLHEEEKTHISTRVAGTIGYIAPEYALWGYLTYKADVYSFGILALEIASGKHNMSYGPENKYTCLLDWASNLQQNGKLLELVDEELGGEYNKC
ncbi:probable leucine-rich repeat receptor-like serine/threonine-protein kinase At3g14840 [Gossypium hirsutum]|uniref:non-specific serine/threonine protein kinase n=1 Tax=Gossypium hirsutum TaxID=3635 RepID=A0ABM3BWE4_GOSHI|nr:probable leucine-rich repeat receptor-like serine/threonine-protein kinase At3g14840 [Gossypium hirsutum]